MNLHPRPSPGRHERLVRWRRHGWPHADEDGATLGSEPLGDAIVAANIELLGEPRGCAAARMPWNCALVFDAASRVSTLACVAFAGDMAIKCAVVRAVWRGAFIAFADVIHLLRGAPLAVKRVWRVWYGDGGEMASAVMSFCPFVTSAYSSA